MHYYKHDHHTGTNPKWRGIAAERGVRPLDVYGIWNLLLEHASRQQDRGSVAQFSAADIAAQYDLKKSDVEAILTEFEARGMIANGRVANWNCISATYRPPACRHTGRSAGRPTGVLVLPAVMTLPPSRRNPPKRR
jgi:hypothetical protein